jgi:heat shock protein HtpX
MFYIHHKTIVFFTSLVFANALLFYFSSRKISEFENRVQIVEEKGQHLQGTKKLKEIVNMVKSISAKKGINCPAIGTYPSNEINAFATGPKGHTLLAFSSALIRRLSIEEIKGIVGHEMSHLINYDIMRILVLGSFVDSFVLIFTFFLNQLNQRSYDSIEGSERRASETHDNIVNFVIFMFAKLIALILNLMTKILLFSYIRKRELLADLGGAKIFGIETMINSLKRMLYFENKNWIVDGVDMTEGEKFEEINSLSTTSLLKLNPKKKRRF